MAYEDLRERGLLEEVRPNFALVSTLIGRARRDLATARATVSIDREWAYLIAHQAMARAARALVMAEGLRPRGRDPLYGSSAMLTSCRVAPSRRLSDLPPSYMENG